MSKDLFAEKAPPKTTKCNNCERKHLIKIHWENNQFSAIEEIVRTYCNYCTSGRYEPKVHDYFKQWEAYATP